MNENESEIAPKPMERIRQNSLELLRLVAREVVRRLEGAAESSKGQNDVAAAPTTQSDHSIRLIRHRLLE